MKALVTGGGGFLGHRIVELLLERGDEVSILARGRYPEVEALGVTGVQADLQDADAVMAAVEGMDVVFHVAAKAGYWGPLEAYRGINVIGTQNVIAACKAHGVKKLIYTSTPSVVGYDGDVENGSQDLPYATEHGSPYPQSKAEAEQCVLAANGQAGLCTVSLRPHLIFGPRDNHLLTRVVERAKTGALRIVGDGDNLVDMTFVDNAAWAHLDAEQALTSPDASPAGKAYFISNDEPVKVWEFINALLTALEVPPLSRKVSLGTANTLGWLMETAWSVLPLSGEPRMTRFLAAGLARHHWYDQAPAKQDFNYTIRVPMDEGLKQTVAWFQSRGT